MEVTIRELISAVSGTLLSGDESAVFCGVTTDTREDCAGKLFIPLVGERFDGHDYIKTAFEKGAVASLCSKPYEGACVLVEDTLRALQDLSAYVRQQRDIPVVGITGSVGKTTTKEMLALTVGSKYHTHKTEKNYNNHIGVPLTLLKLDETHEAAVVEMGMNNAGELAVLTRLARPTVAVFTNVGLTHIGNLGSQENILRAKLEMLEGLSPDGTAVLNADDPLLWREKGKLSHKVLTYGIKNPEADIKATDIRLAEQSVTFCVDGETVCLPQPGEHSVYNALAAIAGGLAVGAELPKMARALETFSGTKMRLNIQNLRDFRVIEDCYNASPASVAVALHVLKDLKCGGKRIAVLGNMNELGDYAASEHERVGRLVAELKLDFLVAVGDLAKGIADGAVAAGFDSKSLRVFDNNLAASAFLNTIVEAEDVVLVKGSHSTHLEEIIKALG